MTEPAAPLAEDEPLLEYQLPHNLEAEQSVIGGLLLAPERYDLIEGRLAREDFFHRGYGEIFDCIAALQQRGQPIDILVLKEELAGRGKLDMVGGHETLLSLLEAVPTGAHVEYYATIVREKSMQRRLIAAATEIVRKATSAGVQDTPALLEEAESAIFAVGEKQGGASTATIRDVLKETWKRIEENQSDHGTIIGLPTDYYELDQKTSGFQEDQLIIVAGRPGMGKSTFALNIARRVAVDHHFGVLIFSLEMNAMNIAQNMLCAQARVDAQRLRTGAMSAEEWEHLGKSTDALSQAPLFINDKPAISLGEIRREARLMKKQHDIRLCVVDYLQLVTASSLAAGRSREQEISEISRGLKALAKELQIPVMALSQLNRKPEGRADNKPILSDLRESGAIEQDADIVILLHRPDYYGGEDAATPGLAEVILAKQRNGPTGTVELTFIDRQLRFENMSLRPADAPPPAAEEDL